MSDASPSTADGGGTDLHRGIDRPAAAASAIDQAALEWQVTLWSGEVTTEERSRFERWLRADPAHEMSWQRVQRLGLHLGSLPKAVASKALRTAKPAAGRRHLLRGLGALVGTGVLAHLVSETPQWQAATADHGTRRGERRDVVLPDGTTVTLNTASAIDVRYTERERRIVLRTGEILVSTAHEGAAVYRPLVVGTDAGDVRAVGTRFTVRRLAEGTADAVLVQVLEGAVEVVARRDAGAVRVAASEQTRFTPSRVDRPGASPALSAAWARGLLIAERQRLGDFLVELARYRAGVLRCDPAVADLVVSGVYPLGDTDAVLQSLAQALPVSVRTTTPFWVTVTSP